MKLCKQSQTSFKKKEENETKNTKKFASVCLDTKFTD